MSTKGKESGSDKSRVAPKRQSGPCLPVPPGFTFQAPVGRALYLNAQTHVVVGADGQPRFRCWSDTCEDYVTEELTLDGYDLYTVRCALLKGGLNAYLFERERPEPFLQLTAWVSEGKPFSPTEAQLISCATRVVTVDQGREAVSRLMPELTQTIVNALKPAD